MFEIEIWLKDEIVIFYKDDLAVDHCNLFQVNTLSVGCIRVLSSYITRSV